MELSQGEIIQKPKMRELSSLFITHRLIVMYAPVKFHDIYSIRFWSYGLDTKVGRTDGQTDGRMGRTAVTLNALPLFFEYAGA